jgi:CRISPR system Cascade subunit CasD
MNTLLLRLVGPMQSWGVQSRFSVRDTGLEPSKSGVLGLVCAAMGINRQDDESLATLTGLRMGVRVDREGRLSRDYHTALKVLKAGGGIKETEPSSRYYLADAAFLVGLEGEDLALLEKIQAALAKPIWPLFLGRKAFIPGLPIYLPDGLKSRLCLVDALQIYPYQGRGKPLDNFRLVLEDLNGALTHPDQPVSLRQNERRFAPRRVNVRFLVKPIPILEEA